MNSKIKILITLISLVFLSLSVHAQAGEMPKIVGVYDKLQGAEFKFNGKTVEVVEYISFYCHTCYNFEDSIPVIKGNFPKKIKWKLVPIYWGEHGSPKPGEAYLIAEEMGKGEAMKKELFLASMVQKIDIAEISILEDIADKIGLGSEFGKKLRAGAKAGEVQRAMDTAQKIGINETPTIIIAGNIKTDPHKIDHNIDVFRDNVIVIIKSILKAE